MTAEEALREAGKEPEDLIQKYLPEDSAAYCKKALQACGIYEGDTTTMGKALVSACAYGLYLEDLVKILTDALEDTLGKCKKAKYRLASWGDIHYAMTLEGK